MSDADYVQSPPQIDTGVNGDQPPAQHSKSPHDRNKAFLRAARAGNREQVLQFIANGVDIDASNTKGLHALHLASMKDHLDVVRELLHHGAHIDAVTKKGSTALHTASLAGHHTNVAILLENGANVNAQSLNGFTSLYMAAQENHETAVRHLLAHGASQNLTTKDGFTPLAVALQQGHESIVALLKEYGCVTKVKRPALRTAAKKTSFASRLKLHATAHTNAIAPTIRLTASAIVTAAGILGIVAFSLAPFFTMFPIFAVGPNRAARGPENTTDAHHYQKLDFEIVCASNSTGDTAITLRCTSENPSGNSSAHSTLNCGAHSTSMAQLMQLQNDGKCVIVNADLTNETRVVPTKQDNSPVDMFGIVLAYIIAGIMLLAAVAFYTRKSVKAINVFLFYRRMLTSSPALSPQALRGHFLTPKWQKYFRCALVVSSSLFLYHGLFALLAPYVPSKLVDVWVLVTFFTPLFPLHFNCDMSYWTTFAQSLPDRVFENGVIDHEEIERTCWKEWKEERRIHKQERQDEIKKKYETEMGRLREEFE